MNERCNTAGYGPAYGRRGIPWRKGWAHGFRRPRYNVPVNIDEKSDHYQVSVYATGFNREAIKLSVMDDVLLISGSRTMNDQEEPNFLKQEFPVKNFERMISLEGKVDVAAITAKQEDGVLYIKLPKTEEAKQPSREIIVD
jgi:HSP20 family protein